MLITKKESKQLRYFARANYKADVKGTTAEDGSKVKHRDFPVFGLSYDEKKADKGMVEITNIHVLYKPFKGTTFEELMEALNNVLGSDDVGEKVEAVGQNYEPCLLHGPECTQEPLSSGPPIVQRLKESVTGKVLEVMAASVSELTHPEIKVVNSEIKDLSKDGTLTVDVKAVANNPVDKVNVEIKPVGDHVEITPVAEIPAEIVPEANSVPDEPVDAADLLNTPIKVYTDTHATADSDVLIYPKPVEKPTETASVSDPFGELTGMANPTWSSGGENVESLNAIHAAVTVEKIHNDFETAVQEAKETGTPVITAEQRKNTIHLDAAAEGTNDVTTVVDVQKLKKLSRAELYDLQMKCGVMRLATLYGEAPCTGLDILMKKYPDAASRLNKVYAADGIKTYTITEEAIMKAYPDEYAALRN